MFKNKKSLFFVLALTTITIIGLIDWTLIKKNANKIDGVNYGPPTQSEIEETQRHKDYLSQQYQSKSKERNTYGSSGKKSVKPFITYWKQDQLTLDFELNGYVPGVVENNATCKVILTKGTLKVIQEKAALNNVQDTACGRITIGRNRLEAGDWRIVLNYESASSSGVSNMLTVYIK